MPDWTGAYGRFLRRLWDRLTEPVPGSTRWVYEQPWPFQEGIANTIPMQSRVRKPMSLSEEGAAIIRTQHAVDQLQAMITTIVNSLDDCESVLASGFENPIPPGSWVIPKSRHDKNVLVVLANARIALELAGRRWTTTFERPRCSATIDGPKVGAHVVLWRKQCRNLTRHPSGLCHVHRDPGWYIGKPKTDTSR